MGASHSKMRQRSRRAVPHDAAVVDDPLELGGGSTALSGCQVCLPAYIRRIEAGHIADKQNLLKLVGGRSSQSIGPRIRLAPPPPAMSGALIAKAGHPE